MLEINIFWLLFVAIHLIVNGFLLFIGIITKQELRSILFVLFLGLEVLIVDGVVRLIKSTI